MKDITTIPIGVLKKDLQESIEDIEVCERALLRCITHTSDGTSVRDRMIDNKHFVEVITEELKRRVE
jgi:hypothetical protein